MPEFRVVSDFKPTGDQPQAIEQLVEGLGHGYQHQTLLGATGTGKTYSIAKVVEQVQRPTLVITRRFGPRVRLGALFTDLELLPNQPILDYYCVSCTLCIAACPTSALGLDGLDRSRCIAEFEPDAAMVKLQKRLGQFPTPHTRLQCAACVSACPIGKRLPTRFWGLDPR